MTKKKSRIPEFKSTQEEAEFWDTHDLTDFLDELTPVKVKFELSQPVTVRFDHRTLNELETQAQLRGIGSSTLIRMWIMEHLRRTKHENVSRAA